MLNYEITFIVDPVLSSDEIEATAQTYVEMLTDADCSIVHRNAMGLKQLAYPINKRTSGVYFCIEFQAQDGTIIPRAELALTRDERIMRYLTVRLDKYGVKYNQDKRDGKIGSKRKDDKSESKVAAKPTIVKSAPVAAPLKHADGIDSSEEE